ncbi:LCP family protein [candidate division WWE3 bacterium]|uniref:LCP family protein n=1 Tax=candidate division WWE3 bacterium TaxID=2053526 RepID=A0A7X9DL63_UNCKA|nr:LCP family protein [candidate division WWE3 bacterium]
MRKSVLIGIFVLAGVFGIAAYVTSNKSLVPDIVKKTTPEAKKKVINPFGKLIEELEPVGEEPKSPLAKKDILNIILIGIDRRNKSQTGFNTDTLVLVSINPKTDKVLLTSIPRDLWINGDKINALFSVYGPETLMDAFAKISGQQVDGYVMCDFSDFKWLVDSFGGVPVNIERTFTDYNFPNDSDTAVETITFTQGPEIMNGNRALTFARSRKGDNGEGSDLMRAKRQQTILKGFLEAVKQPTSKFWPFDITAFYNAVTAVDKMKTTLTLEDSIYLWDFYKDKDKYKIESFVLDDNYIYHPGLYPDSEYHAWVYIPKDSAWTQLHTDVQNKLESTGSITL